MDQVEEYHLPPNPAKMTDARAKGYVEEHGDESWELDALDPATLTGLIRDAVESYRDKDAWVKAVEEEEKHRRQLAAASRQWPQIAETL